MCTFIGGAAFGQWTPTSFNKVDTKKKGRAVTAQLSGVRENGYYKLDLNLLRSQLKNAQEMGSHATPVVISFPTLSGKIEKFNVYSFPVLVKSLADQYQLGSYIGASIDDPTKTIRFSVSPKGLNSMIMGEGGYEFIDPQNSDKTVYGVHPKTVKTGNKSFACTTSESPVAVKEVEKLLQKGKSFTNQPGVFSKASDKKYRTMRLAISVTGEYTQYHGGTVADAVDAINVTMSRVNGVFEKDFALHLNVQDFQNLIFTDPLNDPYSDSDDMDNWNVELQNTLTNATGVGNANYDIGHLFGADGGGGNAGCIGCVCINPTSDTDTAKGSGFTSPANGEPEGDAFDIDYVAHEMGHQLGANHTFSHALEGSGVNMEPGSGSTIMGYAGITGANNNVQLNSDAYFHIASIGQVQENLIDKTCDVETVITNNPPVIGDLPTYNIPKGTAFVLTASATDPENDPLTYTWEEVDDALVNINRNNLGLTASGASFRSKLPSTSPTRYFPKLESVIGGVLNNANNEWEAVSTRARTTNFAVTVRDNNANILQQQSDYKIQTVVVGNNGPFRLANSYADVNTPTPIEWIVANTNAAPYNVANVKIDYTTDEGATWTVLTNSTENDGVENVTFPSSLNGQTVKVRISSIGNIFYAVGKVTLGPISACSDNAPTNIEVSNITNFSASVSWMSYTGATYKVRYKKTSTSAWTEIDTNVPSINLDNLLDGTAYEVQVALVCGTTVGTYSASVNFTTPAITYCTASTMDGSILYISNVTVGNINNSTAGAPYSNYTTSTALQVNLTKGAAPYPISATIANAQYVGVAAFIDFNKDGSFDEGELVLDYPVGNPTGPIAGTFTVPNDAIEGTPLRMRVVAFYAGPNNLGAYLPVEFACGLNFYNGEVEDYNVVISPAALATSEVVKKDNFGIYPNPVSDILNVTKVSNKATYEIHNTVGQIVKNGTINNNKVNVTQLLKGNYIITIKDNNISESFKFIKK
ncbi:zinc-dependent metalloprotease family protein [Chryseobacterium sp. MYb264]|uniref:reprolysin-like metallopeptidase n=1 Tax=Chryseobacterium sp. MYb264 TaxID=2745153 RepID=UPI002E160A99|nr:zinc-dependent metalloprotease family protein [Chryseobacterium sp. MYb264]